MLAIGLAAMPTLASATPGTRSSVRYIVATTSSSAVTGAADQVRQRGGRVQSVYSSVLHGFSATMTPAQARRLAAEDQVQSVVRDVIFTSSSSSRRTSVQARPTWGLDRIDQRSATGDKTYLYDTTGRGVTAFVLDTGIRSQHSQFGGRVSSGYDFVDGDRVASDCNGHGTHVAGTIGGSTYGAAKGVHYVAVRVMNCEGEGWVSDIIAGLDWVVAHRPAGPSLVNLSLGGDAYPALDQAVERTVAAGIPVVVAAGNSGGDACDESPARAPHAITVAATDASDDRPYWSNYGRCIDLFAPGVGIRSASNTSNSSTEVMSGTSMAAPHVTGVVARYLQAYPVATPAQVSTALLSAATRDKVKDTDGSPNRMLYAALQGPVRTVSPILLGGSSQ